MLECNCVSETLEAFIEFRKCHRYRLYMYMCFDPRTIVQNVSSLFVRNYPRLLRYLAEVLSTHTHSHTHARTHAHPKVKSSVLSEIRIKEP